MMTFPCTETEWQEEDSASMHEIAVSYMAGIVS
jgi:hypothetical protein